MLSFLQAADGCTWTLVMQTIKNYLMQSTNDQQ